MDKTEMLEILKLLSALESWSFSTKVNLPDYLHERLANTIAFLGTEILSAEVKKPPSL